MRWCQSGLFSLLLICVIHAFQFLPKEGDFVMSEALWEANMPVRQLIANAIATGAQVKYVNKNNHSNYACRIALKDLKRLPLRRYRVYQLTAHSHSIETSTNPVRGPTIDLANESESTFIYYRIGDDMNSLWVDKDDKSWTEKEDSRLFCAQSMIADPYGSAVSSQALWDANTAVRSAMADVLDLNSGFLKCLVPRSRPFDSHIFNPIDLQFQLKNQTLSQSISFDSSLSYTAYDSGAGSMYKSKEFFAFKNEILRRRKNLIEGEPLMLQFPIEKLRYTETISAPVPDINVYQSATVEPLLRISSASEDNYTVDCLKNLIVENNLITTHKFTNKFVFRSDIEQEMSGNLENRCSSNDPNLLRTYEDYSKSNPLHRIVRVGEIINLKDFIEEDFHLAKQEALNIYVKLPQKTPIIRFPENESASLYQKKNMCKSKSINDPLKRRGMVLLSNYTSYIDEVQDLKFDECVIQDELHFDPYVRENKNTLENSSISRSRFNPVGVPSPLNVHSALEVFVAPQMAVADREHAEWEILDDFDSVKGSLFEKLMLERCNKEKEKFISELRAKEYEVVSGHLVLPIDLESLFDENVKNDKSMNQKKQNFKNLINAHEDQENNLTVENWIDVF